MEYRVEHDTMGEVKVPAEHHWGAQTQRSLDNFRIGTERMPQEVIRAFAYLKKACALANFELGKLSGGRRMPSPPPATLFCPGNTGRNFL